MGSVWIDYAKVKEAVSVRAVLERIGHPFTSRPDGTVLAACPIHKGHNPRQFRGTPSGRGFHCFGKDCRAHGNVIDLVTALEGLPFREAATKLARDFAIREALTRESAPAGHPRQRKAARGAAHARRP